LGPGSEKNLGTEEDRVPHGRARRWFRNSDEEDMADQAPAIGSAMAALVVLVFYLLRRLSRSRRQIVLD